MCLACKPVIGRTYLLEDAASGTLAQNKAFHALVQEYFNSGCYSDNVNTWLELKKHIKHRLGAGFSEYIYWNGERLERTKDISSIPVSVLNDRKSKVQGILKSWADYTKKERRECMDNLIKEMHTAGVQTKKFYEILEGMESEAI